MTVTIPTTLAYVLATAEAILKAVVRFTRQDIDLTKGGNRAWVNRNKDYFIKSQIGNTLLEVYSNWGLETEQITEWITDYIHEGQAEDDRRYATQQKNEGVE